MGLRSLFQANPTRMTTVERSPTGVVPSRVEVAGCIACGKTTLVRMIEGHVEEAVYEDHAANPFWSLFFADPDAYAFETEISFLLQHYHFAKRAKVDTHEVVVMDHSFELDMAYAAVGLSGSRKSIFDAIYREIMVEIGGPKALVFVRCQTKHALERVRARARPGEENISLGFLERLSRELERRVAAAADETPVVCVDSSDTDFRNAGPWVEDLCRRLGIG